MNPRVPGPALPPAGQSLFDAVVGDPVPFPFSKLVARIEKRLGNRVRCRRVLIPLGRSLQRSAAAPEFFKYPRAVVALDAEPDDSCGVAVKDRLFLGYQEKAGVIEVLSYNETAGRFEFQLVKGYREGATPHVYYAQRAVCVGCHQNHAPIFPRQLWDETNSNPRVSHLLLKEGRTFYGFPIQQSADVPYQIDNAVHRANEFSTYQLLWMHGDGTEPDGIRSIQMRATWLKAMLVCRLTGACEIRGQSPYGPHLVAIMRANWQAKWPRGLRIPNPEIADRNPLAILSREGPQNDAQTTAFLADRQKNIDTEFEPATPRSPLEVWRAEPDRLQRVITGLSTFFQNADIREIDRALHQRNTEVLRYRATCTAEVASTRIQLQCASGGPASFAMEGLLYLRGGLATGVIAKLGVVGQTEVRDLDIAAGHVSLDRDGVHGSIALVRLDGGGSARCADGNSIERIELNGHDAVLVSRRDFEILDAAVDELVRSAQVGRTGVLASGPFRPSTVRQALFEVLGIKPGPPACLAAGGQPRAPILATN